MSIRGPVAPRVIMDACPVLNLECESYLVVVMWRQTKAFSAIVLLLEYHQYYTPDYTPKSPVNIIHSALVFHVDGARGRR